MAAAPGRQPLLDECVAVLRQCALSYDHRTSDYRKDDNYLKIFMLRLVLTAVLIVAAVSTTIVSYQELRQNETRLFVSKFNSVTENALQTTVKSFDRMNSAVQQMSVIMGHNFPDKELWPNVAWPGFQPAAELLKSMSLLEGLFVLPIVKPENVLEYETYIADYYSSGIDPYSDNDTYILPLFYPGAVYRCDYSTTPWQYYVDHYGNVTVTESPYQIMVPIAQYTISSIAGPRSVGYNGHADPLYMPSIDAVLDCAKEMNSGRGEQRSNSSVFSDWRRSVGCGAITPSVTVPYATLAVPNPVVEDVVGILVQPSFPLNDPTVTVGLVGGGISWKKLLTDVVPASISRIVCVIESDSDLYTFEIIYGVPEFLGVGDHHDPEFSHYKRSSALLNADVHLTESSTYTLAFYPCEEYLNEFRTGFPLTAPMALLAIFLFCSLLFGLYDLLMRRRFGHHQAVLDTKRRFVRFISHEIRTPLNTVRLGMKLLDVEMDKFEKGLEVRSDPRELQVQLRTTLRAWRHLTDEIVESSESAVEVLNDLLNYDKIELGTLKLEFSTFDMRALAERTTSMMQVQAQQKNIVIQLYHTTESASVSSGDRSSAGCRASPTVGFVGHKEESFTEQNDERVVVGDAARMGQVLRNLISNALKFTPARGEVTVTGAAVTPSSQHQLCLSSPSCFFLFHYVVELTNIGRTQPEKVRQASPLFQGLVQAGAMRVAVKDSGAGLTPQQLEEICAEGVQFNANELQAGQGSGLGLFISKGIVEQHGGRLLVESEGLGKGVTFTVEMPLFRSPASSGSGKKSVANASDKHAAPSPSLPAIPPTPALSSVLSSAQPSALCLPAVAAQNKMLVVDDSTLSRKMLIRLLKSRDHLCEQAEDGQQAIETYKQMMARGEPPDAILMDFEMPVMNGPTATARLREMGCTCLIAGVTGNVLPADVKLFVERGADSVLPKPLVLEDFELLLISHQRSLPCEQPAPLRVSRKNSPPTFMLNFTGTPPVAASTKRRSRTSEDVYVCTEENV
jgi:signal transduction histidine kinase/ActR/RegA family two-component response regulator